MSDFVILKNEYLTVKLLKSGACIKEISDNNGKILTVGKKASVLFPVCGSVYDNKINISGKSYEIIQNGFAKEKEFTLMEYYEDYAEFFLSSDEDTVKNYPFAFNLMVSYKLLGKSVLINFKVDNFSEYKMPFSIGINMYLPVDKKTDNVSLNFACEEDFKGYYIKDGLLSDSVEFENNIVLNKNSRKGFVLKNIKSDFVDVLYDGNKCKFDISEFENLYIKRSDDNMCIGAWKGSCDAADTPNDFVKKEDIIVLNESSSFETNLALSFDN